MKIKYESKMNKHIVLVIWLQIGSQIQRQIMQTYESQNETRTHNSELHCSVVFDRLSHKL